MSYKENLEIYLNLPRKELQGLCKTNNLPANRSKIELAKSLASFFKEKNAFPTVSKERHNPVELSSSKSFVPDTQSKETSENSNKDVVGEYAERRDIQDSDSHKVPPEEERGACRQHLSSGKQIEISSHMDGQTVKNAYNIVGNALCPTTESPQVFALTTSGAGNGSPLTNGRVNSHCLTDRPSNEMYKSPEVKKCGQTLLNCAAPSNEVHERELDQNTQPRAADCYLKGRVMPPKRNISEATPSFQFFVASEEGINLHVDLNSSPLEWISGLKNGVAETLNAQHRIPIIPNHNVKYIAVNGCLKISEHGNGGINLHSNGERTSGCTTSTLSSVSEICQSEGCQPDATAVSSESSVLTSGSLPVEITGGLDGNIMVLSSCATHSSVHKSTTVDATCPENGSALPQNLVDVNKCDTLHVDTPAGPIGISNTEGTRKPEEVDCATLNNEVDGSNNVEAKILSRSLSSSSLEEKKLLKLDEIEKHVLISDNLKIDNDACQVSEECGAKEGSLEVQGRHSRSSSACQLSGQLQLDCPVTEAQSVAGSADELLNLDDCILGSSSVNDQVATLNDELVIMTPDKEIKNSSDKNSKRCHSPEDNEELQNKRHRPEGNKSEVTVNLRSTRASAKETIPEEVLRPRRSTRLLTK